MSAGYQPIAIAAANLIAMSAISLVTSMASACMVCCCRPHRKRCDMYITDAVSNEESEGDVWSRRSQETIITDASW